MILVSGRFLCAPEQNMTKHDKVVVVWVGRGGNLQCYDQYRGPLKAKQLQKQKCLDHGNERASSTRGLFQIMTSSAKCTEDL